MNYWPEYILLIYLLVFSQFVIAASIVFLAVQAKRRNELLRKKKKEMYHIDLTRMMK